MMTASSGLYMCVREAIDIGKRSLQGFNADIVSDNEKTNRDRHCRSSLILKMQSEMHYSRTPSSSSIYLHVSS